MKAELYGVLTVFLALVLLNYTLFFDDTVPGLPRDCHGGHHDRFLVVPNLANLLRR